MSIDLHPDRPIGWYFWLGLIALLAIAVGSAGLVSLPIDAHEAFVLRTVEEMHARQDWVLPFFNGEPRLTKPPLSYWLTGLIGVLSGNLDQLDPWQARLPSLLSGLVLVALAAHLGKRMFTPATGIAAALILATSLGFFEYTHSARPEMLYACLCCAMLIPYVGWRESLEPGLMPVLGIWLFFGLATLAKGPQLPLMFLMAMSLHLWQSGAGGKPMLRLWHPLGILLAAVVALPWWWLVHHRLGGAVLGGSQLSGALLKPQVQQWLDPYYAYRTLQLVIPWLFPALVAIKTFRREDWRGWPGFMALLVLVPAILLSFGPQKRYFYMLPALLPLCVLLAHAALNLKVSSLWHRRAAAILLAGGLLYGTLHSSGMERASMLLGAATIMGFACWAQNRKLGTFADTAMVGLFVAITFTLLGSSQLVWSVQRMNQAALAMEAAKQAAPPASLLALGVTPEIQEIFVYYSHRNIPLLADADALKQAMQQIPGNRAWVVMPAARRDQLAPGMQVHSDMTIPAKGGDPELVLAEIALTPQ